MTAKYLQATLGSCLQWLKAPSRPRAQRRHEAGTALGRRLLVIDDDDRVRAGLCTQLEALGFEVVQAQNGQAGLAYLGGEPSQPSIHGVLLDLHMPVLGGLAVLQELRHRQIRIPVIAMSELEDIDIVRQAIRLGAHEYLLKPFDPELLHTKCVRCFTPNANRRHEVSAPS